MRPFRRAHAARARRPPKVQPGASRHAEFAHTTRTTQAAHRPASIPAVRIRVYSTTGGRGTHNLT